jgi:hypothetical protein
LFAALIVLALLHSARQGWQFGSWRIGRAQVDEPALKPQ